MTVPFLSNGQKHSKKLPFFKDKFVKDSAVLPKPIGTGLAILYMNQGFKMEKININGQAVDFFEVNKVDGQDMIAMPRVDLWLLPFLNVYGFVGYIKGELETNIHVQDPDFDEINFDLPMTFQYTGAYYGLGASLAFGQKNFFTLLDGNYAIAKLSNINDSLTMYMTSARFGYAFNPKWSTWIGTMYQDVNQTLTQKYEDLEMQVTVGVKHPMNYLIGTKYSFGDFNLVIEGGFIGRTQALTSLEYRF